MRIETKRLIVALLLAVCPMPAQDGASVPFPIGYRKWVHIASIFRGPQNAVFKDQPCTKPCGGGVFHYYANEKALEGYRTGKFPDGAIIADEFIELQEAPRESNASYEGARRGVGVMVRDSIRYASTGGWGFESYKGDSREPDHASKQCYSCHNALRKDHDLTFLGYKE